MYSLKGEIFMNCDKFRSIRYRVSDEADYMITFDIEKLKIVREIIIDNCSIIKHCKEQFNVMNIDSDIKNIQRFHRSRIKNVKKNDKISRYKGIRIPFIYNYTYDEYIYPLIVSIIDCIIQNKEISVSHMYHFFKPKDIDIENYNAYKDIEYVQSLLDEYKETSDEKKLNEVKVLMDQQCHFELEKPQKSIKDYSDELKNCFTVVPYTLTDNFNNIVNGQENTQLSGSGLRKK